MKLLSRILFFLSSFSILPPPRKKQDLILDQVAKTHTSAPDFLRHSLRQYDCNAHYFLKKLWVSFNIFSILTIIPLFLVLWARSLRQVKNVQQPDISLYHRVPKDIADGFGTKYVKKPLGYLRKRDFKYIFKIFFQSGFRPYFLFRSIWKIAVYSELMDTYQPQRIWVTQEMVFESSLLTHYLSDFNIKHINFMHGDNYFSIQIAFSTFSEFYVWDPYYIDLFKSLRISAHKFHLFSALDRLTSDFEMKNILKYYNQESNTAESFNKVLNNLEIFAKKKNCRLMVRLHPLHKKQYEIDVLKARNIEVESNKVDFVDSAYESKYVCSEFSSVLYQASLLKRKIVIDNTFPDRINLIKDLDPIFIKKLEHEFLVTS